MYVRQVFHQQLIVQHHHQHVDLMLVINHVKTIISQETSSWPINDDNKYDWILETDQIVKLGLFNFIDPANGYTCTLHIHNAITRLG